MNNKNKCPHCQKDFKNPGALASHIRLKHKPMDTRDTPDKIAKQADVDRVLNANRNLLAANYKLMDEIDKLKDEVYFEKFSHPLLLQSGNYCQYCGELMNKHQKTGQRFLCPKDFKK